MVKFKIIYTIRILFLFIAFILALVGVVSPIAVGIFWEELQSIYKVPLLICIGFIFVISLIGMGFFLKQLKESIVRFKTHPSEYIPGKTARYNKIAPFLIIAIVFIGYNYYYPEWYYYLGVKPEFGPYIALNGPAGIQISWDSRSMTQSYVEYGNDSKNLIQNAYGGEYYWDTTKADSLHHCVLLPDLTPNMTYYYRIPNIGSEIYSFHTRPLDGQIDNIIFTILGDTQGNYNIQSLNIALMKQKTGGLTAWDFTIIAGDSVNRDDDIPEWSMLFNDKSYGGIAKTVPWMICSGNHETGSDYEQPPRDHFKRYFQNAFVSNWENPDNCWDIGTYYSFNYSNVHVVMVDALEQRNFTLSPRQLAWLNQDLANAKSANFWTFVVFHPSMYSTSDHGSVPQIADQMEPLMKQYQIDAIFWGHDHIFEAFKAFTNLTYGGTYCFMVSGGGGSLKDVTDYDTMGDRLWDGTTNEYGNYINNVSVASDDRFDKLRGIEWQMYGEKVHHFMKVEVQGNNATFTAYRTMDGSIIQSYTLIRH